LEFGHVVRGHGAHDGQGGHVAVGHCGAGGHRVRSHGGHSPILHGLLHPAMHGGHLGTLDFNTYLDMSGSGGTSLLRIYRVISGIGWHGGIELLRTYFDISGIGGQIGHIRDGSIGGSGQPLASDGLYGQLHGRRLLQFVHKL